MVKRSTDRPQFTLKIKPAKSDAHTLQFRFKSLDDKRTYDGKVDTRQPELSLAWQTAPSNDAIKLELEQKIHRCIAKRRAWISHVEELVTQIELWAKDLQWSTRRIDKRMDDPHVGPYMVPALMLQQDLVQILLEPVSRLVPGGDGLVDLYLIPAYDDIASLFLRENGWYVHYYFPTSPIVATIDEAESKPLTKEVLSEVLDEMKKNVT